MLAHQTLRRNFGPFEEEVAALRQKTHETTYEEVARIDGHIASGTSMDVFRLSDPRYVAKLPFESVDRGTSSLHELKLSVNGLVPLIGQRNTEQIMAYSKKKETLGLVTQYAPGPTMNMLKEQERHDILERDFRALLRAFTVMQRKRIRFDDSASNIVYDRAHGFTVLDCLYEGRNYRRQTLERKVVTFASDNILLKRASAGYAPPYARLFYTACNDVLGPVYAQAVRNTWQELGFTLEKAA